MTLAERYLKQLLIFACKLCAKPFGAASQLVQDVAYWRDRVSWLSTQSLGEASDPQNLEGWRHKTRGRRRAPWDGVFVHAWGMKWKTTINDSCRLSPTELFNWFRNEAYEYVGGCNPEIGREKLLNKKKNKIAKQLCLQKLLPEVKEIQPIFPYDSGTAVALHIIGDSQIVVDWLNGGRRNNVPYCYDCVSALMEHLEQGWHEGLCRLRTGTAPFNRRFNTTADALATIGMVTTSVWFKNTTNMPITKFIEVRFDGGYNAEGVSACGIHAMGCTGLGQPWYDIASLSITNDDTCSSTSLHAEFLVLRLQFTLVSPLYVIMIFNSKTIQLCFQGVGSHDSLKDLDSMVRQQHGWRAYNWATT